MALAWRAGHLRARDYVEVAKFLRANLPEGVIRAGVSAPRKRPA